MKKNRQILRIAVCAAAVLAVLAAVAALWMLLWSGDGMSADGMDPKGQITLQALESGKLSLSWPEGKGGDGYLVEVLSGQNGEVISSAYTEGQTNCELPALPNEMLTIRINTLVNTEGGMRTGKTALEVTGIFSEPKLTQLEWNIKLNEKQLYLTYQLEENCSALFYRVNADGTRTQEDTLSAQEKTVTFGKDYPELKEGQSAGFAMGVMRQGKQYTVYGLQSKTITIYGEQLLGTALMLEYVDLGENIYTFTWNETRGEYYELQRLDGANAGWVTVCRVEKDAPRTYTTGVLERYTNYQFRVVAYGKQALPNSDYSAQPSSVKITTGASAMYCTVWPQKDLEVFSDAQRTEVLGTAKGAQAFCVLAVENGMFRVKWNNTYGYLDRNYCMINLPEFLGDICRFNITNSYGSLYMIHAYELPGITGCQLPGYEKTMMPDNRFLVPLLYTSALKLEKAAIAAEAHGYRMVVYDAFRPAKTENAIYIQTAAVSSQLLPERTYYNLIGQFTGLTYSQLITNKGRGKIADYIFENGSPNSQGIAVDVTLENINSFKELPMQTMMHDQSWYSNNGRNTEAATLLGQIMTEVGFAGNAAKWWNFLDNETKDALDINSYLWEGVCGQGWMADGNGWRYRLENGTYYVSTTVDIDGTSYTFDSNGYLQ